MLNVGLLVCILYAICHANTINPSPKFQPSTVTTCTNHVLNQSDSYSFTLNTGSLHMVQLGHVTLPFEFSLQSLLLIPCCHILFVHLPTALK